MRETLLAFPQESALLAIYFEESALRQAEERAEIERKSRSASGSGAGMDVDAVIGSDDEMDYFEAQQKGLI